MSKKEKIEEKVEEEAFEAIEGADEKIEASHDADEVAPKVAPPLTGEDLPSVNEELFMVDDEVSLNGVDFLVKEVGGLKLVLVRKDFK